MKDRPQVQDFDWVLLGIVAAINGLGVLEIYSSTHASAMAGMQWKQLMWIGIGLVGMFIISRIDYHTLLDQAPDPLHLRRLRSTGGTGDRFFAFGCEALGVARRRIQFSSVGTDEVDYNHGAGSLLQRSAHGPAYPAEIWSKLALITGDSGSIDSDAARFWDGFGSGPRGCCGGVSRRHRVETPGGRAGPASR